MANEIAKVLRGFGVTGHVSVEMFYGQAIIAVDGKYFGRYDFVRRTFVD